MDKHDLDRRMVPYREETVRIDDVDLEHGARYGLQNREESEVPEETMEDYTAAWQRDDPFPQVILWQSRPGAKYLPIDGYTRCTTALRAGREEINAVIAECDEAKARQLCIEANARHGRRASRDFLIRGAVAMTEEGMSIKEAAARAAVPESVVSERRAVAKTINRAKQNHVNGAESLPESVLEKLANIDLDNVFVALLELARDAKLKPTKVQEIAKSVRDARSEADKLAIVQAERVELGATAADDQAAKVAQPFSRFVGAVSKIRAFDLSEVVKAAHASNIAVADLHEQVNRVREVGAELESMIADIYGDAES